MVYEILSEQERARRLYGDVGVDVVTPAETRGQKFQRRVKRGRERLEETRAKVGARIPSQLSKKNTKRRRQAPERRKQVRKRVQTFLQQNQKRSNANQGLTFSPQRTGRRVHPPSRPAPSGIEAFIGSPKPAPRRKGKRKGQRKQKPFTWY